MIETLKIITPLITFILGAYLGHVFTLRRDNRKEILEAVKPIREWIIEQKKYMRADIEHSIPALVLDTYVRALKSAKVRSRFQSAYMTYLKVAEDETNQNRSSPADYGDLMFLTTYIGYKDTTVIVTALDKLEEITRH